MKILKFKNSSSDITKNLYELPLEINILLFMINCYVVLLLINLIIEIALVEFDVKLKIFVDIFNLIKLLLALGNFVFIFYFFLSLFFLFLFFTIKDIILFFNKIYSMYKTFKVVRFTDIN